MGARGYDHDFAARCFNQIKGFGSYGFPESHAIAFARLVWVSSWLKHHYPAVFAAGLLNSQPMGFYAPAQIVRDAREHGVEVRQIDVNASHWDNSIEGAALRLGLRQITGFRAAWAETLVAARPFARLEELARFKARPVLVHCATGSRSHDAAELLKAGGFAEVFNLQGGIGAWQQAGMPVEK
jgi:error-prone DNA polymerase